MRMKHNHYKKMSLVANVLLALVMALPLAFAMPSQPANAAACSPTNYGSSETTVTATASAQYRMWSRMMSPSPTNNSYWLQVETPTGVHCFKVGGRTLQSSEVNKWLWVDYRDGTAEKIQLQLPQGTHKVKFIGNQPGVKLDRFIITSDLSCVPQGFGDNCNVPVSNNTIKITTPAPNATVSGTVKVAADASSSLGIAKVEFLVNSKVQATATKAPFTFDWDTTALPNGDHRLIANVYDVSGQMATDSFTVRVSNDNAQPPSTPTGVSATAPLHNRVNVSWQPSSTTGSSLSGYTVFRNGVPIVFVETGTTYVDTRVQANTRYEYQVRATDTNGMRSGVSAKATVQTPNIPDTQVPSTPAGLQATAASSSQINLKWQASSDNVGVVRYEVYRQQGTAAAQKVADVTGTTFGDASLKPATEYTYYVVAVDGAGNKSAASARATAKTQPLPATGIIQGRVFSGKTNKPTVAKVDITINGVKRTYTTNNAGEYIIRNLSPATYPVTYYKGSEYLPETLNIQSNNNTVTRDVTLKVR